MTEYESGVWDAVALINELEDMELEWDDVLGAIKLKADYDKYFAEQAEKIGGK
jgi:hypothetical protein